MKKIVFSLFILLLCVTPLFVSTALKKTTVTYADQCNSEVYSLSECYPSAVSDVFDLVTKELIDFYEKDFNPAKPITGMTDEHLKTLMKTYGISQNKLNTLLILQDIAKLNGERVSLNKLVKFSTKQLFAFGQKHFTAYVEKLPKEKKEQINKDLAKIKFPSLTF